MSILERETALVFIKADEAGRTPEVLDRLSADTALERQALSEAVQVFAAMTVESAVNLLGVILLGEQQFLQELERRSASGKLSVLLASLEGAAPETDDELLIIAERLATARNSFVHPKPQEGPHRHVPRQRRADLASAKAAVDDMERFLALVRKRNHRYGTFFLPF